MRYATYDDIDNVKKLWNYCFDDDESFVDYYFRSKYKNENTIVIEKDKKIISSLQLNQYKIKLNNKVYDTSYIVGVSTLPEARGKGYMKDIMSYALNEIYKKGQLVSILMPIDFRLYRKFGYENCYDQIQYTINVDDLKNFKIKDDFFEIYESNISYINKEFNVNGNIVKDESYYKNLIKEIKSENGYIYANGNGGYLVYFINKDEIFVREIYYEDIDYLKSMLKFLYNHNTQSKKIIIMAPINDSIRYVLDNPKTCDIKIKPFMMGRVINVFEFLNTLDIKYSEDISCTFSIKDEFIKENNSTFKISIKNSKMKVERIDFNGYNILDIKSFSQIAFSYSSLEELVFLNKLSLDEEAKRFLNSTFNKKINYINEYV